tara:strand:- start:57 stop:266 length:210 start_codon:yes stop_codon:yes gene_type:complete
MFFFCHFRETLFYLKLNIVPETSFTGKEGQNSKRSQETTIFNGCSTRLALEVYQHSEKLFFQTASSQPT